WALDVVSELRLQLFAARLTSLLALLFVVFPRGAHFSALFLALGALGLEGCLLLVGHVLELLLELLFAGFFALFLGFLALFFPRLGLLLHLLDAGLRLG